MNLAEKILSTGTRTLPSPVAAGMYQKELITGVDVSDYGPVVVFSDGKRVLAKHLELTQSKVAAAVMAQLPPDLQVGDMLEMTQPHKNLKKGDRLRVIETGNGYITLGGIDNGLIRVPVDGDWLRGFTKWPDDYQRPYPEGGPHWELSGGRKVQLPIQWPTLIQEMTQLLVEIEQIKSRIQSIIRNHEKSTRNN